jgi:hypothetical protein
MQGIYSDDGGTGGQPPEVLAAWIQELLGDVHDTHVPRLAQLAAQLQSGAFEWDSAALAQALTTLHSAGRELQVRHLRQGWLARLLGRHRAPAARFAAAYERIVACAARLKMEAAELAGGLKPHLAGARRVLVELEMECKALQQEVDRGVTWLQELVTQMAHLRADDHPQLPALADAAQQATAQFKWLQSLATVAREIGVRGNHLLARRTALVEQVRADSEAFDKGWVAAARPAAEAVKEHRHPAPLLADAAAAHESLMKRLETATDACAALQDEEHLMAQQLGLLRGDLQPR